MKKTWVQFACTFALPFLLLACGGGKKNDSQTDTTKTAKESTKTEETKKEPEKSAEPTELGDYDMKCTEANEASKLVFEGKTIDGKTLNKAFAFNFGGTLQLVYLANFEPDMKMLESGNIDNKKLQAGQFLVKLEFSRKNNKANKDLITTLAPYNRVITSKPEDESENRLLAYMHTAGKSYGSRFLGNGMLSGVTKKMVCGKVEMKGENDENYQLACTFSVANKLK
jgi:hypothetical protein